MIALEIINIYCLGIDLSRWLYIRIKRWTINLLILYMFYSNNTIKKRKIKKGNNILILISKLNDGGAERVAINIAENLSKKYNVTLLSYKEKTEVDYPVNNIEHLTITGEEIQLIRKIRKIKKQRDINYCISFCTGANFLNIASRYKEEVVISIRNFISSLAKRERIKNKMMGKFADKIVAVSDSVKQDVIENFNMKEEKIVTIENFYEKEKIEKQLMCQNALNKEEEKIFKNSKIVINVGRLSYQKAQGNLIRAFKEVVNKNNNIKLIIIGQGKLEKELRALITELELENNVFLLGFKTNPYQYLKRADVFILSSLYEGMPNVVLEAMACGLPVIATDSKGGNREILAPSKIKDEYGVLIPTPNYNCSSIDELSEEEKQMAKAILEMVENEDLSKHYKQQSVKRIQNFSKEKIIEKWYKIIE